jgi:hypothetical protein
MPPLKEKVIPPEAEKSRPERQQEVKHKGANPPLSEPLRAAIEWGIAGAITGALGWAWMDSAAGSFNYELNNLIGCFFLGLGAAVMLYRSALSLGRAASAGAVLMISQYAAFSVFFPLMGESGLNLINGVTYLVPAVFDPRLRTRSFLLKVLAVSIASALVIIGILSALEDEPSLRFHWYWIITILSRLMIFGLFGYEIAQRRLR